MQERSTRLRRLGIRGSIAAFVAAWAIVFGQLVLGHDPALSRQNGGQAQHRSATGSTQSTQSTQAGDSSESESGPDDSGSSGLAPPPAPAPVTSSQS